MSAIIVSLMYFWFRPLLYGTGVCGGPKAKRPAKVREGGGF